MKKISTLLTLLLMFAVARASHLSPNILFTAHLTGDQEVPAVTTNGEGVATFYLSAKRDSMCIRASWLGLSGPVTGAHIHLGKKGVSGGVEIDLGSGINGNQLYFSLNSTQLSTQVIERFLSGMYYINIHTQANQGGEIRGQILAEDDPTFYASLDTAQETGNVTGPNGKGAAVFRFNRNMDSLWFDVTFDSLSGTVSDAHIHYGAFGVQGPAILPLKTFVSGNKIMGVVPTRPSFLDSMLDGKTYINIHTTQNPAGEIRGQLWQSPVLGFDAMLDTAQETNAVLLSNAMGTAHVHLNNRLDTLHVLVQVTGLSGSITGAHFHSAEFGIAGPVALNLVPLVNGNRIEGIITGSAVSDTIIDLMMRGGLYINVHTTLNSGGETRGQVYRHLREGYPIELDKDQETDTVNSGGRGVGFASINREQTNVFYMVAASNLTGAITGAHFHMAPPDSSGPVIFNIGSSFAQTGTSDFGMGSFSMSDPGHQAAFRENRMYVNLHTFAYGSGEIRGQVSRMMPCSAPPLSVNDPAIQALFSMYPNPTTGLVTIQLPEEVYVSVVLTDVSGRTLLNLAERSRQFDIDMSGYRAGIYFLTIVSGDKSETVKVFKQ